MSHQSPHTLLATSAVLCLAVASACVALALRTPWTGLDFAPVPEGEEGIRVTQVNPAGPNARSRGGLVRGSVMQAFVVREETIVASPRLLVEEPDVLPTFVELNELMRWQSRLTAAARADALWVRTPSGEHHRLHTAARPLGELPGMFWLQLCFGIGGALTGALVWGARRRDRAAQLYALTGLGYLVFAPAAAVYSTRELLLDGEVFRWLSAANHFGALLFTASLAGLLWHYPQPLRRWPVAALCYVLSFGLWLADVTQLVSPVFFHVAVLGVFSLSVLFAAGQWWQTRRRPAERAALRWFLLSIYLATGLFAGMVIVPAALGLPLGASQGLMFGAFLLMYWGLALGIVRYRLFQLERWWHAIVGWFVGGLCVVLLDGVLLAGLSLPEDVALPLAVAIVGWLYFPVRQLLWERMGRRDTRDLGAWLPRILPLLIDASREDDAEQLLQTRWSEMLRVVWRPLRLEQCGGALSCARIEDNGLSLSVPVLERADTHLRVTCPDQGRRLFTGRDLAILDTLRDLVRLALETYRARDAGAQQERDRIRRDLHDDIGARLLTLLHACEPRLQHLVREALVDTRALVQTLELGASDSGTAAASWREEIEQRCEAAGVELAWHADTDVTLQLSARDVANLTRVLREAVSNALRHGQANRIAVDIRSIAEGLTITVTDNGSAPPLSQWKRGRGRHIMQERAREIGAELAWYVESGCTVQLVLPARSTRPSESSRELPPRLRATGATTAARP